MKLSACTSASSEKYDRDIQQLELRLEIWKPISGRRASAHACQLLWHGSRQLR